MRRKSRRCSINAASMAGSSRTASFALAYLSRFGYFHARCGCVKLKAKIMNTAELSTTSGRGRTLECLHASRTSLRRSILARPVAGMRCRAGRA